MAQIVQGIAVVHRDGLLREALANIARRVAPEGPVRSLPSLEALQQAESDLFEALAERLEAWAQHWPEGRGIGTGSAALEQVRLALEAAEAAAWA